MAQLHIAGRKIDAGQPPYIVAELSGNHNQCLDRAFKILEAARDAGADAVKLQTYTADTITIDHNGPGFVSGLPLWKGRRLYDLYSEAHTPWEWHGALFARGHELGLTVFSSPFDVTAVDFLESLGAPAYKIASFELTDIPLIEKCAGTGKPLIISTGMGSVLEIDDAVSAARRKGATEIALLQCVSSYPAPADQAYLRNIPELASRFNVAVGLSDHTLSNAVAIAATALGANVIEKHVTLRRADGGVDSAFSLEPHELRQLVEETRIAFAAAQGPHFGPKPAEQNSLTLRKSIYVVSDISAGEEFSSRNLKVIRPAYGLAPKHLSQVLGRRAVRDLKRGEPLQLDMIEQQGL